MQSAAYAMSLDDVVAFLREVKIEEPILVLQDYEYNGAEFLSVIESNESNELAELNLTSACQKLKVKVLFTRHLLKRVSDIAKDFPTSKLVEFCRTKKQLMKCADVSFDIVSNRVILWYFPWFQVLWHFGISYKTICEIESV